LILAWPIAAIADETPALGRLVVRRTQILIESRLTLTEGTKIPISDWIEH
jgi:hypothetical protein